MLRPAPSASIRVNPLRRSHAALRVRVSSTVARNRPSAGASNSPNSISVADLDDSALKERIAGLEVIRDQAQDDVKRAQAILESSSRQAITPAMVRTFAGTARERMRIEGGGYR